MPNRKPSSKQSAAASVPNQKKHDKSASYFSQRLLKRMLGFALAFILVLYFGAAAGVLALRYAVLPHLDTWRPRIEQMASRALHAPVSIGALQGSWQGLQTSLSVTQLKILDQQGQPALVVPHAAATLSWRSLLLLQPILSNLTIEAPMLRVQRSRDGTLSIAGISARSSDQKQSHWASWVLAQEAIVLRNGTVYWQDAQHDTPPVTLTQLRFTMLNYRQQHRLGLQAEIEGGPLAGPLDIRARFRHGRLSRVDNMREWKGTAYLSTGTIDLPTLNRFLKLPIAVSGGQLDARTWLKFSQGQIQGLNGSLIARELSLRAAPHLPALNLPKLSLIYHAQRIENELSLRIRNLSMQLANAADTPKLLPHQQNFTAQRLHARYRAATVTRGRHFKERFSVDGDFLDVGLFAKLAHALPLHSSIISNLDRFKLDGLLRNYAFEGEFAAPASTTSQSASPSLMPLVRYRLKADFENASLAPLSNGLQHEPNASERASSGLPGFTHLSGSISASERHGLLKLAAQKASLTLPGWLDEPKLSFDTLHGEAYWTIKKISSSTTLNAKLKSLSFANADAAGKLQATYYQTDSNLGTLNLTTQFSRAAIKRIPRYLPTTLSKALRTYLGHALIEGTAHDATIEIKGPLDAFPFHQAKTPGIFRIYAPFEGGSFNPSPKQARRNASGVLTEWPSFEGIKGVFEIDRNTLKFDVEQAHYRGVTLSRTHGQINDLTKSADLILEGQANGPLNDLLHYLRHTPIPQWIGLPADQLQAKENAKLSLRMHIPSDGSSRIGAIGTLEFLNNSLSFSTLPPLSQLTGQLKFTEKSASLEQISAQWLGGKVNIAGAVKQNDKLTLDASGNLSTQALYKHLAQHDHASPLPVLTQRFDGIAPYKISVQIPTDRKDSPATITAHANLRAVSIDLPAPLAKTAHQPMSLRFALRPVSPGHVDKSAPTSSSTSEARTQAAAPITSHLSQLELHLGPLTAIYLQRGGPQPAVVSGALSFNRPAILPTHGVVARAHFKQFDLDAWQVFVNKLMTRPTVTTKPTDTESGLFSNMSAAYLPTSFALHFNMLTFADRHWPHLNLKAWHNHEVWRAQLVAPNIAGDILLRQASASAQHELNRASTLTAHLVRLAIPAPIHTNVKSKTLEKRADNPPSLNLKIDALSIHDKALGSLEMALRNTTTATTPGLISWQLDKLQLTHPAAQLTATGSWQEPQSHLPVVSPPATPHASFNFKLALHNAGALLNHFGLAGTLRDGSGTLAGSLNWHGKLAPIDYTTLAGSFSLDLQRGQIVQVEPGLGKLIGVLSLQSLAHFLTLDFRELTSTGLTFERMTASADIARGIARTEDFKIISSLAEIQVKGNADLAQEQQNLQVDVKPAINVGSAVVAAAIVNPILGIGSYLAQQVLSASVSRTLAAQYSVSGSWNNPRIERIDVQNNKQNIRNAE